MKNSLSGLVWFIRRTMLELKDKGILYVLKAGFMVINNYLGYRLYLYSHPQRYFLFNKEKIAYLYHWHNASWRNERAIEVPIVYNYIKRYQGKKILEIGNVLSFYYQTKHDIVDKYEVDTKIIREDIVDFSPFLKYDLIVSISTLEHIGWDEQPKNPKKALYAIKQIKNLLAVHGLGIITLPVGYNSYLDSYIRQNKIIFDRIHYFKRRTLNNDWEEVKQKELEQVKYNYPYLNANGIIIGIIKN
jgi:hypothetical protein